MHRFIDFFIKAGELKEERQRSFVLRKIENPPTIASHCFREGLMAWVLSPETKLNQEKILKFVLLHDLVAGYAGDLTPYEPYLQEIEDGEPAPREVFEKWVRLSKPDKEKFFKEKTTKERKALEEIFKKVPNDVKEEAEKLWDEYENLSSPEAQFIYQVDILEIFMQALMYWDEDSDFPIEPCWQRMKETIHHPKLLEFLKELEERYHGSKQKSTG